MHRLSEICWLQLLQFVKSLLFFNFLFLYCLKIRFKSIKVLTCFVDSYRFWKIPIVFPIVFCTILCCIWIWNVNFWIQRSYAAQNIFLAFYFIFKVNPIINELYSHGCKWSCQVHLLLIKRYFLQGFKLENCYFSTVFWCW